LLSISTVLEVRRDLFCDLKKLFFNEKEVPSSASSLLPVLFKKRRRKEVESMMLDLAGSELHREKEAP